jgi:hypothetical protein
MLWILLVVLAVAAMADHSFYIAGVLGGAALFVALTQK